MAMTRKRSFSLWTAILVAGLFLCPGLSEGQSLSSVRAGVSQIAEFMSREQSKMSGSHCSVRGDVTTGCCGWGCHPESTEEGDSRARRECECTTCERLYKIVVRNETDFAVKVYLFRPNESRFRTGSSLFFWELEPGEKARLNVKGKGPVYMPKSAGIMAKSADGGVSWRPRRIGGFNYEIKNTPGGQELVMSLTYKP